MTHLSPLILCNVCEKTFDWSTQLTLEMADAWCMVQQWICCTVFSSFYVFFFCFDMFSSGLTTEETWSNPYRLEQMCESFFESQISTFFFFTFDSGSLNTYFFVYVLYRTRRGCMCRTHKIIQFQKWKWKGERTERAVNAVYAKRNGSNRQPDGILDGVVRMNIYIQHSVGPMENWRRITKASENGAGTDKQFSG